MRHVPAPLLLIFACGLLLVACGGSSFVPGDGDADWTDDERFELPAETEPDDDAEPERELQDGDRDATEVEREEAADGDGEPDDEPDRDPDLEEDSIEAEQSEGEAVSSCLDLIRPGEAFEPFATEPDTQIHPFALFDGQAVWFAAGLPDPGGSGKFGIGLTRRGCDGSPLVAPVRIDTASGVNNVTPRLALSGTTLLAVWNGDDGVGPGNMNVYLRRFGLEGAPPGTEAQELHPSRAGLPVTGNLMMPAVAGRPDGSGWLLAGLWGIDAAPGFQAFLQPVGIDGVPAGEGIDGALLPAASQMYPAVAVAPDGSACLAWTESPNDETDVERLRLARLGQGAIATDAPNDLCPTGWCTGASLAPAGNGLLLAFAGGVSTRPDIGLVPLDPGCAPDGSPLLTATDGGLDHSPVLAAGPDEGAVVWYRVISGIRSDLFIHGFDLVAGRPVLRGERRKLNGSPAPGYFPAGLVRLGPGLYLAVWAEGNSPAFRLKAAAVDLR